MKGRYDALQDEAGYHVVEWEEWKGRHHGWGPLSEPDSEAEMILDMIEDRRLLKRNTESYREREREVKRKMMSIESS